MGWRFLPSLDVGSNATVSHCLLCMERIELGAELPQVRLYGYTAADVYTALEMASVRVDISLRTCAYTDAISADEPP